MESRRPLAVSTSAAHTTEAHSRMPKAMMTSRSRWKQVVPKQSRLPVSGSVRTAVCSGASTTAPRSTRLHNSFHWMCATAAAGSLKSEKPRRCHHFAAPGHARICANERHLSGAPALSGRSAANVIRRDGLPSRGSASESMAARAPKAVVPDLATRALAEPGDKCCVWTLRKKVEQSNDHTADRLEPKWRRRAH